LCVVGAWLVEAGVVMADVGPASAWFAVWPAAVIVAGVGLSMAVAWPETLSDMAAVEVDISVEVSLRIACHQGIGSGREGLRVAKMEVREWPRRVEASVVHREVHFVAATVGGGHLPCAPRHRGRAGPTPAQGAKLAVQLGIRR